MDNKVVVISAGELTQFLQPIIQRLEKIEAFLYKKDTKSNAVFSDAEGQ